MSIDDPWSQVDYGVRFDWGPVGAARIGQQGLLVIVDVLSFTTSVTVLVEHGTAVYPAPWRDARAAQLAAEIDAALAVGRREITEGTPYTLSPAALRGAPPTERLVLPSPNGSAIAAASSSTPIVAACLRNASAVAGWLARGPIRDGVPVNVVAAGERWPDGSLRPAWEDLIGSGAVIAAAQHAVPELVASPEAKAAASAFTGIRDLAAGLHECASGRELTAGGFGADVDIAAEFDVSDVVPVLTRAAFTAASD